MSDWRLESNAHDPHLDAAGTTITIAKVWNETKGSLAWRLNAAEPPKDSYTPEEIAAAKGRMAALHDAMLEKLALLKGLPPGVIAGVHMKMKAALSNASANEPALVWERAQKEAAEEAEADDKRAAESDKRAEIQAEASTGASDVTGDGVSKVDDARQRMMKRNASAWKR